MNTVRNKRNKVWIKRNMIIIIQNAVIGLAAAMDINRITRIIVDTTDTIMAISTMHSAIHRAIPMKNETMRTKAVMITNRKITNMATTITNTTATTTVTITTAISSINRKITAAYLCAYQAICLLGQTGPILLMKHVYVTVKWIQEPRCGDHQDLD